MSATVWFPKRWPVSDPNVIQLYSMATPNGQKVGVGLEETGLAYEPHLINITKDDQFDPDFLRISPNNKIPAIIDPNGPEGEPIHLMESIVILQYLADKSDKFFPTTYRARLEAQQWLAFQVGHLGPMFGQFGHFHVYNKDQIGSYGDTRYSNETRRLLGVLNKRLSDHQYLIGDYSIVDMATCPWVECLAGAYNAWEHLGMGEFEHVERWRKQVTQRPAYQRGIVVCKPG